MATTRSLMGPTPFLHPFNKNNNNNNNNNAALIKSLHLSSSATSVHVTMSVADHQQPPPPPHPSFEILGGALHRFFPSLTQHLTRPYNPFPFIAWNRHVETIFASFFRSTPDVTLRRQCLRTQDGGSVALDWVPGDDRRLLPDAPLLILLVS
jgi:hypothetical protein